MIFAVHKIKTNIYLVVSEKSSNFASENNFITMTTTYITSIPVEDRHLYAAMMKKMGWMTKMVKTTFSNETENTRTAEIICEAKQAIDNFKNGTAETVSLDTFLQELV